MKDKTIPLPPLRYRMMQAIMWPMMKLLGMTCKNAFDLASAQMDMPLTRTDKFRLRIHLLFCGICRKLPAQLANQRAWIRCCNHEESDLRSKGETLTIEARKRIQQHLHKEGNA